MSENRQWPVKLFTLEEANARLPLIRAICGDWVELAQELFERRQRLSHLMAGRPRREGDFYSDELAQSEAELERDLERLRGFVDELRDLGVDPKQPGLVDFPAMMDGRIVYLCWQHNEPEVSHWHELDAGFAGRQPLQTPALSGDNAV